MTVSHNFGRAGRDVAIADLLGGFDGGWSFWTAMLSALELAIARSRERDQAFSSFPAGELRRFLREVDDALGLAVTAVTIQEVINGEEPSSSAAARHEAIDEVLEDRLRQITSAQRR